MINRYASLRQGLVGAWCPSLGASGFRLIDRSGNNNHGVLTNMDPGTDWVLSGGKLALNFDGASKYVSITNVVPKLTTNFTWSTWFLNRGNYTAYAALIDTGSTAFTRELSVFLGGNNNQVFFALGRTSGATIGSSMNMQTNTWHHLCLTCAGTTAGATIYLDGRNCGSTTMGIASTFGFSESRIGTNPSGGGAAFNGLQDDTRIYNRALSPSEIRLLYTGGRGVGLMPERIKHRRKASAAATNRRRRLICGANC